jgi:energy-coupling factor transporter ATP-binding protein EcfA2
MRLTRLEVRSLPGLPDGFAVVPGPGVNLVVGPNACGKSSLARAIRSLLWPDSLANAAQHRLAAQVAVGDDVLIARRPPDGTLSWTRDGENVAPPSVPVDHLRDRYELGLLDLAAPGAGEGDFAAEIRLQMTGGYDLDLAGATLFPRAPSTTTKRLKEYQRRQFACDALAREFNSLRERERGLAALREDLAEAMRSAGDAAALDAALQVVPARVAEQEAAAALAAFPVALAAFRVDDQPLLEDGLERLRLSATEVATAERRLAAAEAEIATMAAMRSATPDGAADPSLVQPVVESWKAAETARDTAAAAAASARSGHAAAAAGLGGAGVEAGAAPDRAAIDRLGRLFVEAEAARARKAAAEALLADPVTAGAAGGDERAAGGLLDDALAAIDLWLAAAQPSPTWPLVAAGAGVLIGVALLTTAAGGGVPVAPLALAAALVAGGGALAARALLAARDVARLAGRARAALAAAGITEPMADRAAAARVRDRWLKEAARRDHGGGARARLQAEAQKAEADLRKAEADARELRLACGLGADLDGLGVTRDVAIVANLLRAQDDVTQADALLAERERQLAARTAEAGAAFARAGREAPVNAAAAAGALQAWRDDLGRRRSLQDTGDGQREQLAAARQRQDAAAATLAQLRKRLELADDGSQDDHVHQFKGRHAAWLAASRAHDSARTTRLLREEAVSPAHRALTAPELERLRAAAGAAVDRAETLRGEIAAIEAKVEAARSGRAYEQALVEFEQERDRLVDDRAQARRSALADALLDDLRARNAATRRPAVLERAAGLLKEFTQDRYRLDVQGGAEEAPAFTAFDTHAGVRQSPAELSDGTRAQLLLAVRLAFIETMEPGSPLPLFLDEALTTTDGDRFAAVAAALGAIARDQGRQVFYLTSQPHDINAWRQALAARGLPAPQVLDLAAARGLARAAQPTQLPPPATPAVPRPAPGPAGLAAWRLAMHVPPFDPRREPDAQHVDWLLLDDADLLHRLAVARADLVGVALAGSGRLVDGGVLTTAAAETLAMRAMLLRSFTSYWRIGRGRTVTVEDIDTSGAVSATMRGRVLELLAETDGDPARFAAGLDRVHNLREATAAKLLDYLRDTGAIDEQEILDEAAVLQRVLADAGLRAARDGAAPPDAAMVRDCVARWWLAAEAAIAS